MADAEQILSHWFNHSNPLIRGKAYHQLASTYADCGRFETVRGLLDQALHEFQESKVQDLTLRCQLSIAQEDLRLHEYDSYRELANEVKESAIPLGDKKALSLLEA